MSSILQYAPGSMVTIVFQVLGSLGTREDGYAAPIVSKVILPNLTESTIYPISMMKIHTGLYYHKFKLPDGYAAVGSYIIDIIYSNAANDIKNDFIQIVCVPVGGSFSISPS